MSRKVIKPSKKMTGKEVEAVREQLDKMFYNKEHPGYGKPLSKKYRGKKRS